MSEIELVLEESPSHSGCCLEFPKESRRLKSVVE